MTDSQHDDNQDQDRLFHEGIDLFNRGLYFECHEALEDLWNQQQGPEKQFTQGLIQIAVGTHQLRHDNLTGALKLYRRGSARLQNFVPVHRGIDVAGLLSQIAHLTAIRDKTVKLKIKRL